MEKHYKIHHKIVIAATEMLISSEKPTPEQKQNLRAMLKELAGFYNIKIKMTQKIGTFKTNYLAFLKNEQGYGITITKLYNSI